jgi:hypothetical protein
MNRFIYVFIVLFLLSTASYAQGADTATGPAVRGQDQTGEEQKKPSAEELEKLRREALREAEQTSEEEPAETTVFKSGALGLQAMNPEISVSGDFLNIYRDGPSENEFTDFTFRGLGLHLESYLDPYSRFKAAVGAGPEGAELEEAYVMRYGVVGGLNLTLGKFRQQFGVVNRWHKHALDWADFPLPILLIFGDEGLNQTGFSGDWSGSAGGLSDGIEVQVTEGSNQSLFAQNARKRPSILAHYKLYRDISSSTYFELGMTGLVGWNDAWDTGGDMLEEETRDSEVYGLDCSVVWEPTDRMRYRNIEWRTEFYYVNKNVLAPDSSGKATLNPWGVYTSLQAKMSRTVDVGARFDYYRPDVETFAAGPGVSLSPLAVTKDGAYRWQASPYITWWQSPFVKFRLEYDHEDGKGMGEREDRFIVQCVFAAGPHKHDRY